MVLLETGLRIALTVSGLLLPGWGWARWAGVPLRPVAAGLISALQLFAGVLTLQLLSVAITLPALTGWLLFAGLPGWWLATRARTAPPSATTLDFRPPWWAWLIALPALAVALQLATAQPLSGIDNAFRWQHLARLIFEHGHFEFYPPRNPEDFTLYFWADGIAPLVSSLYLWCFLAAHSTDPVWTAPAVILQVAGLYALAAAVAGHLGGRRAAGFAWVLLAGSTLFQFAVNLGQETGLTALGAGSMVFYLLRWQVQPTDHRPLVLAAIAGALAACAREYGAIGAIGAAAWIGFDQRAPRKAFRFLALAAVPALLWHLRNTVLTGTPFYAHDLPGLPTNPVFAAEMRFFRHEFARPLTSLSTWTDALRLLGLNALPPLVGLLGFLCFKEVTRTTRALLAAVVTGFFAAWIASVSSTAGGYYYSMRVLSPVLLLGAAGGGAWIGSYFRRASPSIPLLFALASLGVLGSLRAWVPPAYPLETAPARWPTAAIDFRYGFDRASAPLLNWVATHADGRVLTDCPALYDVFNPAGAKSAPFWSPELSWLFAPLAPDSPDAGTRLLAAGYSHVLLMRPALNTAFLQQHHAFDNLKRCLTFQRIDENLVLFRIHPRSPSVTAP